MLIVNHKMVIKAINTKRLLILFLCVFGRLNTIGQECPYHIVIFFSDESSIQTGLGGIRLGCYGYTLPSGLVSSFSIYKPRMSYVDGVVYRQNEKTEYLTNKILNKLRRHKFVSVTQNDVIPDDIKENRVKDGWFVLIPELDESCYQNDGIDVTIFQVVPNGNIFKRMKIHRDIRVMNRIEKRAVELKNASTEDLRISPKPKRSINLSIQEP